MAPGDLIDHLVGMQAQVPDAPYIGLWTRLDGFHVDTLARLVRERRVVRMALMRSTIHLVTVRDAAILRPLMQPAVERGLWTGNYGRQLRGLDRHAIAAAGRAALEAQPRTFSELGTLLQRRWPKRDANALAMAVRGLLPLVQVPPRGIWGERGGAVHATFERWTGRRLASKPNPAALVPRYLAAFGPASVADMQAWSGLTGLRELVERMRKRLRTFTSHDGKELFDLPNAARPSGDVAAPPRFLPEFDNVLLAHADRTRIVDDRNGVPLFAGAGVTLGAILIDGFVSGRWRIIRNARDVVLTVETPRPLAAATRASVEAEGGRLLRFAVREAPTCAIRFNRLARR